MLVKCTELPLHCKISGWAGFDGATSHQPALSSNPDCLILVGCATSARRGQGEVAAAEEDVGHEGQEEAPEVPADKVECISVIICQEVSGKGCEISTAEEVGEERKGA